MVSKIKAELKDLHPAYFALVMATGIISISTNLLDWSILPRALFLLNIIIYITLLILNVMRIIYYPRQFVADLSDHSRGVGFFTIVAATGVVATQFIVICGNLLLAKILWYIAAGLWLIFMYGIFCALTVKGNKPSLSEGINGGWLVSVVATQSLSVVGCLSLPELGVGKEGLFTIMLALWLCGGMLYIWLISLIFYRYTFFEFSPSDLMPPYWINMGAMAISTLAGATLIQKAADSPLLLSILPFLKGFTLWYWATATWWIPLMALLAIWRHAVKRFPFSYDQGYWGLVFPLGMYTVCTFQLGSAINSDLISAISRGFVYISVLVFSLVFFGFLRRLLTIVFGIRV
jgi:tellurite resistance protein TehA-like permease|tara:strand:+ start:1154 stop:2194 length:1041 start_codon:yes stop_codon:yes gene_type:complete